MGSAAAVQQALTVRDRRRSRHAACLSMWTVIRWGREMLNEISRFGSPYVLAAEGSVGTSDGAHDLSAGRSRCEIAGGVGIYSADTSYHRELFETRVSSALRYVAARDGDVLVAVPLRGELLEGRPDGRQQNDVGTGRLCNGRGERKVLHHVSGHS
jgi:hypothetical protein